MTTLGIHTTAREQLLVYHISGRLDAYWAEQLSGVLEKSLLEGNDQLCLDLTGTDYISSAGIRLLVRMMKKIREVQGKFYISEASPEVTAVLTMVGMGHLIGAPVEQAQAVPGADDRIPVDHPSITGIITCLPASKGLGLRVIGDPASLLAGGVSMNQPEVLCFRQGMFGLGYGCIGEQPFDFTQHAGEFAAFGPQLVFKPADGRGKPDYLTGQPTNQAAMSIGYGLIAEGEFPFCLSFQPAGGADSVLMTDLFNYCFDQTAGPMMALVFIAELDHITGVSLTRPLPEPFSFDLGQVRDHFYVSVDPDYPKHLVIGFGIAERGEQPSLSSCLRPWSADGLVHGHFHAVVLPRKPLRRDETSLTEMIPHVFQDHPVSDILHVLYDDRPEEPVKMTAFTRGWAWFGPVRANLKQTQS